MKKSKLLLLDANVVIKAFELGLWQKLIGRCEIWLASTVIQEADYFMDDQGSSHLIDLSRDLGENRITRFQVVPSELQALWCPL